MWETAFQFKLFPYTVFGSLGFCTALYVLRKTAEEKKISPSAVLRLALKLSVVGFLGSRMLYVFLWRDYYLAEPIEIFSIWKGGMVFYGSLVTTIPYLFYEIRQTKLPFWKTLDCFAIAFPLGHAIGRLGCFFAGCCFGRPTHSIFGVIFHSPVVPEELQNTPLHPTQLYEAFFLFLIFILQKSIFTRLKKPGIPTLFYLTAYPLGRATIELFRGDSQRGFYFTFSTSQILSLAFFILGLVLILIRARDNRDTT